MQGWLRCIYMQEGESPASIPLAGVMGIRFAACVPEPGVAVCPVLFDEAYGEPSGPRLRATPFRSIGRFAPLGDFYTVRWASSNRLGVPGKGTRDPWDEEMAPFACAATFSPRRGGRPADRPYGRGEVLGWARALSPRVGLRGLPGFLVPP